MKNVLVILSSLNNQSGNSTKLANDYVEALQQNSAINLTTRNLSQINLPHLSESEMQAWMTEETERTPDQVKMASISQDIVNDVMNADEIVLAVPMYNFGIPSVLKAWFDRLARAGITFQYTQSGPQGLLKNKKVTVLAARGGKCEGTPLDTQTDYIRNFFAFLGLENTQFVYAEGLAMGEEAFAESWKKANEKIMELISG